MENNTPDYARPTPSPVPPRILVVDDNKDAADSLSALLQFLGAEVHIAYEGSSALEQIAQYRPGVVLLDLVMPGVDGFEVARRVRQDPQCAGLKLIALTALGQDEDRHRTSEAGFDQHLVKPLSPDAIHKLLEAL